MSWRGLNCQVLEWSNQTGKLTVPSLNRSRISKRLKPEKVPLSPTSPSMVPYWMAWIKVKVDQHGLGSHLTIEGAPNKRLLLFYVPKIQRKGEGEQEGGGRDRSGELVSAKSEWRKVSSSLSPLPQSPPSHVKKPQQKHLRKASAKDPP